MAADIANPGDSRNYGFGRPR